MDEDIQPRQRLDSQDIGDSIESVVRKQQLAIEKLQQEVDTLKKLMSRLIFSDSQFDTSDPAGDKLLADLSSISADEPNAVQRAQEILNTHAKTRITKGFVVALKSFLKSRSLGVMTRSGVPAGVIWQSDCGSPYGGYMRLSYYDSDRGRSVQTDSLSYPTNLTIVERPDRRSDRTRKTQ